MEDEIKKMRIDLKDKKEKIRTVAVRLAEQMKHHIVMYEERHQAMDKELRRMSDNLDQKQHAAETEMIRSLEEMDRDVQGGFTKVGSFLNSLEKEMEEKNKLFEEKIREAMKSVQEVLKKEGKTWRNQIREISLINEMHQHIILKSFQNSNGHIENLEKCLEDLSEELATNFKVVEDQMVEMRAEFNTTSLITKIQSNLRFTNMSGVVEKVKKTMNREVKKMEKRVDSERTVAMNMINPMKMHIKKLIGDLNTCQKNIGSVEKEMQKGTGGMRSQIEEINSLVKEIDERNNLFTEEVKGHMGDQDRLLEEHKEVMQSDKTEILEEFEKKKAELEDLDEERKAHIEKLIDQASGRIKENIHAQNHSIWERLVLSEGSKNDDFMLDLMKQNQANFFSFLVGPEDLYKVPQNELEGTKKEWEKKKRNTVNLSPDQSEISNQVSDQSASQNDIN